MPTGGWEPIRTRTISYSESQRRQHPLQGPLRVARLCVLSIIFPGLLLGVPLYMRYNVYTQQPYPIGMSDSRMLDSKISTVWCQKQIVWSNATYNAFLLSQRPELLTGTKQHVSMTRHLRLDDDMKEYWGFYLLKGSVVSVSTCVRWPGASLIMIRGHKHLKQCAYIGDNSSEELDELDETVEGNNTSNEPSNKPHEMKKIMEGVVVHNAANHSTYAMFESNESSDTFKLSDTFSSGKKWQMDRKGTAVHLNYADQIINPKQKYKKENGYYNMQSEPDSHHEKEKKVKSSKEFYDELLMKLNKMGSKGKLILEKLNKELEQTKNQTSFNDTEVTNAPVMKNVPDTNSEEAKKHPKRNLGLKVRHKRDIHLGSELQFDLTRHAEDEDHAMEENMHTPDGISEIHGTINDTTNNDKSNSEFWSSFSSSEERLLDCEGLLLNLPLTPSRKCEANRPDDHLATAAAQNSVTYTVPSNGYYFFVFNSENEVQSNFVRVHFRLEKTVYDLSQARASCTNRTGPCSLPLQFWSDDKVVIELPVRANDSLWNQEYLAVSTCEPRTAIYVGCVLAVPLLIILFAFQ